jgi:hypothetical protein
MIHRANHDHASIAQMQQERLRRMSQRFDFLFRLARSPLSPLFFANKLIQPVQAEWNEAFEPTRQGDELQSPPLRQEKIRYSGDGVGTE